MCVCNPDPVAGYDQLRQLLLTGSYGSESPSPLFARCGQTDRATRADEKQPFGCVAIDFHNCLKVHLRLDL
jgi:hypothetical protein